jgi:hypothetical protein
MRPAWCVREFPARPLARPPVIPIFVVVETIEHKAQPVFDRYLHRGADDLKADTARMAMRAGRTSGDTRTASLDGRSASSENSCARL